jgi:hypothetical protein
MEEKTPLPRCFTERLRSNGRVRDDHAPASMRFEICSRCSQEAGEETIREFQISSVDSGRGVSLFRCVICNSRITIKGV